MPALRTTHTTHTTLLTADEVAARLRIHPATFYRLAWFRARKIRVTPRAVRWAESDVELYLALKGPARGEGAA